jgi:hypothetical protein
MKRNIVNGTLFVSLLVMSLMPAAPAAAQAPPQDVITIPNVPGSLTADVPIYVRDVSGTPLGIDQPFGSRIQSYSLVVHYSPVSAVQSVSITPAGITGNLQPTFQSTPSSPGTITLVDTFNESTNLIPFTSNKPAPGDQIANMHFVLNSLPAGTVITLTLDPVLTDLTNQAGTTQERVGNGTLALVNGTITIVALSSAPTLSTWALILLAISIAVVAVRTRL